MNRQTRLPLCWALVCLAGVSSVATAQGPVPRPKTGSWNPSTPAAASYYGILGEVAKPGVYAVEGREATLQELVQQAGGVTPQASPTIRLVRQNRVQSGVFFNPAGRDVLQPGDMILVESMHSRHDATKPVSVGLIGVLDRPVIVPLRPDNAQIGTVMLALGQSQELARSVRIIVPSRQPMPASLTAPLVSGTVLVFDPRLLIASNLPTFPEALPLARTPEPMATNAAPQQATGAPPTGFPSPQQQLPVQVPDSRLPVTNMAGSNGVEATTLPFSNNRPAPQTNAASLPVPGSRLQPEPVAPKPKKSTKKPVAPKLNVDSEIVPDLDDTELEMGDEIAIEATAPAGFSLWQMLGIGGTVASLVGLAVLSRNFIGRDSPSIPSLRREESIVPPSIQKRSAMPAPHLMRPHRRFDMPEETPAPRASKPVPLSQMPSESAAIPKTEPHDLAELLAMRGPIETEGVILPHGLKLHRSPLGPMPFFRIDDAAMLPGPPHEKPMTAATPQRSLDEAALMPVPAPHFAAASRKTKEPVAEIAEPAMIGGTAIERALHQLQRGKLS